MCVADGMFWQQIPCRSPQVEGLSPTNCRQEWGEAERVWRGRGGGGRALRSRARSRPMSVRLRGCSRPERRWKVEVWPSRRSPCCVPGHTAREVRLTVASPAPAPGPQPRGALGGGATETAPSRALPCPSPAWDQKLNGGFQSSRLPIHSKEEKFRKMVRV